MEEQHGKIPMDLGEALQKGFYASLGATAALLEFWQDPAAREQSLKAWQQELDKLVEKGVSAEIEARNFVDRMVAQQTGAPRPEEPVPTTVDTTAQPADENGTPKDDAQALAELTQQLADLRAELERLRQR